MKLTFGSGTERQKVQWQQALNRLLSLPTSAIPLQVEVNFVDPAELITGHATDLALTTWTYDSPASQTKVRNDAPGYGSQRQTLEALAAKMGLEYNADLHFNETAVHELGHSLFAALPEKHRVKIAQLFGAKTDSLAELQPAGVAWENQIIEGIAETFKEAFLPRRFRVFPNRTNRTIPYDRFPEFRALWRAAVPETVVEEGEEVEHPPFSEAIEQGSGHGFKAGENAFVKELLKACGLGDALFGPEGTSESAFPLLQGRRYQAAEILKNWEEQKPYLNHLRKKGEKLNVFLWMHAFIGSSVGEALTELAYLQSGKKNISPIPIGTIVEKWFDFTVQVVWRDASGALLPGESLNFHYKQQEELVSYPEIEIRPPWGNWHDVGTVYTEFFYNDEASGNPAYSEHPELEFSVPAGAVAIAGFLVGVETYREVFLGEEGPPPFFEKDYVDVFRARSARPERLDFFLPGFKEGEPIFGEGEVIDVPQPILLGHGFARGAHPTKRPTAGFVH